jgi:hypothetical protein
MPAAEEPLKHDTPRGSLRATLRRLGAPAPADDDDDDALRSAVTRALRAAKMPLLRGLLFERGGSCAGCNERAEFVQAVLDSLSRPLVARHALPLFLYDAPLLPHTTTPWHLFEPRYKLLCRKALKSERLFGFVTGAHGTLARITTWRFTDDDAADGSCHITVTGLRRFRMGRQWQDRCAGCSSGPLHMADVRARRDRPRPRCATRAPLLWPLADAPLLGPPPRTGSLPGAPWPRQLLPRPHNCGPCPQTALMPPHARPDAAVASPRVRRSSTSTTPPCPRPGRRAASASSRSRCGSTTRSSTLRRRGTSKRASARRRRCATAGTPCRSGSPPRARRSTSVARPTRRRSSRARQWRSASRRSSRCRRRWPGRSSRVGEGKTKRRGVVLPMGGIVSGEPFKYATYTILVPPRKPACCARKSMPRRARCLRGSWLWSVAMRRHPSTTRRLLKPAAWRLSKRTITVESRQ